MGVKNVVFDFGGVVVNYDPLEYLRGLFDDESTVSYIMENFFESECTRLLDEGKADRAECNAVILKKARDDGYGDEMDLVLRRWTEQLWTKNDTVELVNELRDKDVNVYYLTNMSRDVWSELVGRGLRDIFHGGVASFEVHVTKPDGRIYRELFDRCGLEPSECLFLDDMPANAEGAKRAGMESVVFQNAAQAREELVQRGIMA